MKQVFDKTYQQWVPVKKAANPTSNVVNKKATKGASKAPKRPKY